MTIIICVFFALCLIKMQIADYGKFYNDYMSKKNTVVIEGVFVFLVFFRHYSGYLSYNNSYDTFGVAFNNVMEQTLVTVFLFFSGYGIMKSIKEKEGYLKQIPQKILKIILHFDIAILLYVVFQACLGTPYSFKDIFLSLIAWESIGNSNWYVFAIVCMYLLTWSSFSIFKKNHLFAIAFIVVGCLLFIIMTRIYRQEHWYNTVLCYPMGILTGLWNDSEHITRKRINVVSYLAFLTLAWGGWMLARDYGVYHKWYVSNIYWYSAWNCLFVSIIILLSMKIKIGNPLFQYLGNHVFSIYILQRLPMILFLKIGLMDQHPYMVFVLSFTITLIIADYFDRLMRILDSKLFSHKRTKYNKQQLKEQLKGTSNSIEISNKLIIAFIAISVISITTVSTLYNIKRRVEITALNEKNEKASSSQIYLHNISYNFYIKPIPEPSEGMWENYQDHYCWFEEDDTRNTKTITSSIVLDIDLYKNTSLIFSGNMWKGKVKVATDNWSQIVDTYVDDDQWNNVLVQLPSPKLLEIIKYDGVPILLISVLLFLGCFVLTRIRFRNT